MKKLTGKALVRAATQADDVLPLDVGPGMALILDRMAAADEASVATKDEAEKEKLHDLQERLDRQKDAMCAMILAGRVRTLADAHLQLAVAAGDLSTTVHRGFDDEAVTTEHLERVQRGLRYAIEFLEDELGIDRNANGARYFLLSRGVVAND